MMKNIKLYIAMLLVGLTLSSCFEDESVRADMRYPDLVISNDLDLTAIYLKEFSLKPIFGVLVGQDTILVDESEYDNYTYEWRLDVDPGGYDLDNRLVSSERELSLTVDMVLPSADTYKLVLRATNIEGGFQYIFDYELKVLSEFGQGLFIAHSEDEGVTSDIDLLMALAYNAEFEETDEAIIHRNLFSSRNGGLKIDGVVSDLSFHNSSDVKKLDALVKGVGMYSMNNVSFELESTSGFFHFEPEVFNPQKLVNYYGAYGLILNNGIAHCSSAEPGDKFNYVDEGAYDYEINDGFYNRWNSMRYFGGFFTGYDDKNHRFVFVDVWGDVTEPSPKTTTDEWAFDPGNMPADLEFIAGGIRSYYRTFGLMKDKMTNEFFVYELAATSGYKTSGKAIFDMSNCVDLDRATSYEFSYKYDEFYYTVDNKLYVAILDQDAPSSNVVYSLPSGENFTHLKIHKKVSGSTAWSESESVNDEGETVTSINYTSSIDNVITAASFNGTEGFIRTLPIQYGGVGGIAGEKWVHTYGGFGKISALELRY